MAAALVCGSLTAMAQSAGSFRFGVTGGMNVSNITDTEGDCRIGFNVGLRGEYNITNNVYLNAGLMFSQKGNKYDYDYSSLANLTASVKNNPGYIEIPLAVGYRFDFGNNVYLFGETGPYFAFGVCGKSKLDADANGTSLSEIADRLGIETKTDFFGDGAAQTFDGGWGLRVGVEASGFQVHLGYQYGFSKIIEDSSCHNSNFTIGVSYMF